VKGRLEYVDGQMSGVHVRADIVDQVAAEVVEASDVTGEEHSRTGVPTGQLSGSPGVVVEEEVIDGVALTSAAALEPGLDPGGDALGMCGRALAPLGLGETGMDVHRRTR
jgi:hypothetical protein